MKSSLLAKIGESLSDQAFRLRLRAALRVWIVAVLGFTAVRIIIAMRIVSVSFADAPLEFAKSFAFGLPADGLTAVFLALAAYLMVGWMRRWKTTRVLGHLLLAGLLTVMIFGFVAEVFFWDEFSSRLNGIAVFYIMFPREVIGNLRESFPLEIYLPIIGLAGVAAWAVNRRVFAAALDAGPPAGAWWLRLARFAVVAVVPLGLIALFPQSLSENRELDQLARNGLDTMVQATLTNDADYDGVYPTIPEAEAIPTLRAIVAQDNTTFLPVTGKQPVTLRHVDNGATPKKLNIIMVTEESYGSIFVDSLDNDLGKPISPDLDRLAKDGLLFTNIYAQGDRTVRGLEATETAFAPIPGIATARRPGSQGMDSLPHLLKSFGYTSGVLYGGVATFDNMGDFWSGIGFDHVWDERDIRHESFSTIWGVSDEDLFTETLRRMDEETATGKPVLMTLMTVSNHRPYKFPETHVKWDDSIGKIQNTARYAQWAFVDFVNRARSKPWFDDTVFVFVADHSVKINGAARVPVHSFRIPILFYAPKHIAPGRIDTLGAQIDLFPTLLGMLGFSYDSPFFGIDLMRVPKGGGRIAIAHNFSIAYGRPGHVVVLEPNGQVEGYAFHPGDPEMPPEAPNPAVLKEAIAQTQTAHHLFYGGRYHWK